MESTAWKRSWRGITLVEVMVVTLIIAAAASLAYFALMPSAKRKSREVQVKSDLHQFALAISAYRVDFDDRLPASHEGLIAWSGDRLPNWTLDESYIEPHNSTWAGPVRYFYTMPWSIQQIDEKVPLKTPFNEAENAIVKASFWRKVVGDRMIPHKVTLWPSGEEFDSGRFPLKVLGARIDGSIGWFWSTEDFEIESMNYYSLVRYPG